MPFNGSGGFTRVRNWVADAAAHIKIKSDFHDQEDDNFASGLSNVICRDGQTTISADIPWNGKKITNVAAPTSPTDAATKAYVDSVRSFSTAISLTGAVPEARIGFTVADIGFGARVAGTPTGYLNRFVWNDKPDLSGTDVAVLDENGGFSTTDINLMFNVVHNGATTYQSMTAGYGGWLQFDKTSGNWVLYGTAATLAAGAAALAVPRLTLDLAGNVTIPGSFVSHPAGNFIGNNNGGVVMSPGVPGTCYFRPNGAGSATGQFTVDSAGTATVNGAATIGGSLSVAGTVTSAAGQFIGGASNTILSANGGAVYLRPNGVSNGAGQTYAGADGTLTVGGNLVSQGWFFAQDTTFQVSQPGSTRVFQYGTNIWIGYSLATGDLLARTGAGPRWTCRASDGFFIVPAGAQKPGGGNWGDSSDERIKNVLGDYDSGLAAIKGLHPVRYTFKGNDTGSPPSNLTEGEMPPEGEEEDKTPPTVPYRNSMHYQPALEGTEFVGLIAQEVETAMPGMVTQADAYIDGAPVTDLRMLNTSNLIFALVNAVKELSAKVEALEAK